MAPKLYIGIDPDIRLLTAALVTDQKKALQVFLRRNKGCVGDGAVSGAARAACRLVEDVIAYLVWDKNLHGHETILVIESQNMQHAVQKRRAGRNVDLDDVRRVSQVAGCLMGAFSNLSSQIRLVQGMEWKGNVPKPIHHKRIYGHLNLQFVNENVQNIYPAIDMATWSNDKINPGDYLDINDSIGLALYGAEKGL